MQRLQAQFPEGVAYKTTYNSTAFVLQSIDEVIHTLIEAFILVVIVVFLFLGNVRATLIPLIAVPVSLIGTFAVMLALGFSLNMVSLLALVLAIGIVVDDAIVVVEAVEANLEADHSLSPADAAKRAMGQITAPIIAITHGAAVGVRAGGVHPGHLGPALPAVRGGGRRLDGDLGHQRADPVAGLVRRAPAPPSRARRSRPIRYGAGRDRLRARRLCRDRQRGWCGWPLSASSWSAGSSRSTRGCSR